MAETTACRIGRALCRGRTPAGAGFAAGLGAGLPPGAYRAARAWPDEAGTDPPPEPAAPGTAPNSVREPESVREVESGWAAEPEWAPEPVRERESAWAPDSVRERESSL